MQKIYSQILSGIRFIILILLLSAALFPTVLRAQSIQWSQYTGQNVGPQSYARAVFVEKSPDGSIYVVGAISGNNPPPTFPTTDVIYRGSAYTNNYNTPIHLSKYSSDGKLLWVRIINGSSIQPAGLSLSPSGEPSSYMRPETQILTI